MIKEGNFIVIQSFMVTELKLKGNELLIYAIIYGFSQAEGQRFTGSLQYLADWTNSSKQGITKALKSLVEKGYIQREDKYVNSVKFVEYWCTELHRGIKQSCIGYTTEMHSGIKQSCTNNIDNNIDNSIDNSIDNIYIAEGNPRMTVQKPKSKSEPKHRYGEYKHVLLKDSEYNKLTNDFGESIRDECITFLDEYIEMKGYKAKSHYLCIRKWVLDAVKEKQKKQGSKIGKVQNRLSWIDNITM